LTLYYALYKRAKRLGILIPTSQDWAIRKNDLAALQKLRESHSPKALLQGIWHLPGEVIPKGRLYRTRMVAAIFGVSTRTIRRWIKKGLLKAVRTPRGYLVAL